MTMVADTNRFCLPVANDRRRCVAGDRWLWDGVSFEFLHPPRGAYEDTAVLKDNARSCVLAIRAHGRQILLPADIERDVEAALVQAASPLASDVLVVPHHGSKTSSTPEFLDAVGPATAIVAAGYRNRFRHPAPEVLERYRARGIRILRTDEAGAITVRIGANSSEVEAWRIARPRYWHGR